METDDKRHGGKEAAALSGGHLCHVCGYQYPNPHPSAKLRRSHRKHCGKARPAAAEAEALEEVEEGAVGVGVRVVGEREDRPGHRNRIAAGRTLLGREGGRQREETGTGEANGEGEASRGFAGQVDSSVEDKVVAADCGSLCLFVVFARTAFCDTLKRVKAAKGLAASPLFPG
ncbi:FK506-binding protein 2-1 [Zea mays]|uniref:FK506-binding protein 2-1 n=1 Tax=Zea mays TaxID=4577 RepID=A0A1D6ESM6_MAIZE|nr:FK506-binding protein 2-1 [Zea mays]